MVIAWGYYGNTGLEQGPLEVTGKFRAGIITIRSSELDLTLYNMLLEVDLII